MSYREQKLHNFIFSTEDKTFNVETSVDNLGYITFNFGEAEKSFSFRLDYNNAEQLVSKIKQAQEHLVYQALNEIYNKDAIGRSGNKTKPEEAESGDCDSDNFDVIDPDYKW
tara:strand:+ start:810 stop:1145 length:336 start_codon:yes stop_codon:yes gene_type:complete